MEYLTFNICNIRFPDKLWIKEYFTHNNEQFGSCLIKMKQVLNIFTVILTKPLISQCFPIRRFFPWMLIFNILL